MEENSVYSFEVADRQSFVKFRDLLLKDYHTNSEEWENRTLPEFLEAMSRYTEDIQGYYDNMNLKVNADKADWSIFSDIFKGVVIYE